MPQVVIIEENEKLSTVCEGATFFYHRLMPSVRAKIKRKCTTTKRGVGVTDWDAYAIGIMEAGLDGWENVVDSKRSAVPFSVTVIPYLPEIVKLHLVECLDGAGDAEKIEEEDLPNSESTPSSNS